MCKEGVALCAQNAQQQLHTLHHPWPHCSCRLTSSSPDSSLRHRKQHTRTPAWVDCTVPIAQIIVQTVQPSPACPHP